MNLKSGIKFKVCGMTQIEQVKQLVELGVDYAGFIFYKKSPRYVVDKIRPEELKQLTGINKAGVFVNEDYDVILKTVEAYGLTCVQLHGDETPDFCSRISSQLQTIKAFRISGDEDLASVLRNYNDAVDFYLFDTKAKEYGGTGKKFNWDILQQTSFNKPCFLSGGIGPGDENLVRDFIESDAYNNLYALDLNSKFEDAPGIKNISKLKAFIDELKRYFSGGY